MLRSVVLGILTLKAIVLSEEHRCRPNCKSNDIDTLLLQIIVKLTAEKTLTIIASLVKCGSL